MKRLLVIRGVGRVDKLLSRDRAFDRLKGIVMKRNIQALSAVALVVVLLVTSSPQPSLTVTTQGFIDFGPVLSDYSDVSALLQGPGGEIYGADSGTWQLFLFDPVDKSIVSKGTPPAQQGILALTWGADGLLYGGGQGSTLWTFDPNAESFRNEGQVPGGRRILALTTGHDGVIYIGTQPAQDPSMLGRLFAFDPASRTYSDLGTVEGACSVGTGLVTGPDGRIHGGTGNCDCSGETAHLFVYDPNDGSLTDNGPPIPSLVVRDLIIADDGKIYGGTQGPAHLFSFDPATGSVSDLGVPVEGQQRVHSLAATSHKIYGGTGNCSYSGETAHLFEYDLRTKQFADLGIPVSGEPVIGGLVATTTRDIYGGTAYGGHLFWYQASPELVINYPTGAPGSYFTFTGLGFSSNSLATITINGRTIGTCETDTEGEFIFLVSTTNAEEGVYYITVTSEGSATARLVLDVEEPTRDKEGDGPVFEIPGGIALTRFVFLPSVLR